jgi:hypothetical protein
MIGLGRTPPSEYSRASRSRAKSFVIRLDARLPFGAVLHARVAFFAKLRIPNRANGWREDRAHVVLHPLPTQGGISKSRLQYRPKKGQNGESSSAIYNCG